MVNATLSHQPPVPKRGRAALLVTAVALLLVAAAVVLIGTARRPASTTGLDLVVTQLEDRVREAPQNVEARISLAIAYAERGLTADAIEQFRQALVIAPDNQTALIGLGQALFAIDDMDGADTAFSRVAELNANNERRYSIEQLQGVYYDLAGIAIQRGNMPVAKSRLEEALKVNRTDSDAWRQYGLVLEKLGDDVGAERAYHTAVRFVPNYEEVYVALQELYKRTGDTGRRQYATGMLELTKKQPDRAVKALESAVAAVPNMPQAHEGLGIAYEGVGRTEQALAEYRKAIELSPDMFLSEMAVRRLSGG